MKEILKPKWNKRKIILLAAICLAVVALGGIVGVGAKYIKEFASVRNQIRANEFFFTVDLLGDTQEYSDLDKEIHLFGGEAKSLTFNVQNYFDDLRINDKNITYTVSATCNTSYNGFTLTQGGNTPAASYTLTKDVANHQAFTLALAEGYATLEQNSVVTVTVRSTVPYTKTMKLKFVLHGQPEPVVYRVEDQPGATYATLIVMVSEPVAANQLALNWSSVNQNANVLQIDTNNKYVLDDTLELTTNTPGTYLQGATLTRSLQEKESMQIYFFKTDPTKDYSTVGDIVAPKENGAYQVVIQERA